MRIKRGETEICTLIERNANLINSTSTPSNQAKPDLIEYTPTKSKYTIILCHVHGMIYIRDQEPIIIRNRGAPESISINNNRPGILVLIRKMAIK